MLLLDVDGVISLFGFDHRRPPAGHYALVDGTMHFLSATAAALIDELARAFELVWCTGWEEKANEYLPRALGLPGPLPYLSFDHAVGRANTHWKLDAIDAYSGPDRPLAWIDDALAPECVVWAASRPGPTLLVHTDAPVGVTAAHVERLQAWAGSLRGQLD